MTTDVRWTTAQRIAFWVRWIASPGRHFSAAEQERNAGRSGR